jgi:hypothetical protein
MAGSKARAEMLARADSGYTPPDSATVAVARLGKVAEVEDMILAIESRGEWILMVRGLSREEASALRIALRALRAKPAHATIEVVPPFNHDFDATELDGA